MLKDNPIFDSINWSWISLFCFIQPIGIALVFLATRIGFPLHLQAVLAAICASFMFTLIPLLLKKWIHPAIGILLVLVSFVFAGFLVHRFSIQAEVIVTTLAALVVGVIFCWLQSLKRSSFFQSVSLRTILLFVSMSFLFSIWIACFIYTNGALHPLLYEKMAFNHTQALDTLYFSSIIGMFQTYGQITLGLDGITTLHYHFGSHLIFSYFSYLFSVAPFLFYQLTYPLIFVPLFLLSLLVAITSISKYLGASSLNQPITRGRGFWFVFCLVQVGFIPQNLFEANPVIYIQSQSYCVSLILSFLFISLGIIQFYKIKASQKIGMSDLAFILLSAVLIGYTTLSKVSVGFIIFCLSSYVLLRFFQLQNRSVKKYFILTVVVWFIAFFTIYQRVKPLPHPHYSYFLFLDYFTFSYQVPQIPWIFPVNYIVLWIYFFLRLYQAKMLSQPVSELVKQVKAGLFFDLEILALFFIIGALIPSFFVGAHATYFGDFHRWLTTILFLGFLAQAIPPQRWIPKFFLKGHHDK